MIVEGTNKRLWMDQHKPRTRKITYHLVGQNRFFSLTMKNDIIIFILIVSSPAISPLPTGILHTTFSLTLYFVIFISRKYMYSFLGWPFKSLYLFIHQIFIVCLFFVCSMLVVPALLDYWFFFALIITYLN